MSPVSAMWYRIRDEPTIVIEAFTVPHYCTHCIGKQLLPTQQKKPQAPNKQKNPNPRHNTEGL